jgi:hypothetical protein
LDILAVLAGELEHSTGKKLLIARGVKNGKGTKRATTMTRLQGLVGRQGECIFGLWVCVQREIRKGTLSTYSYIDHGRITFYERL